MTFDDHVQVRRDANGRLTCSYDRVGAKTFLVACGAISERFGLEPRGDSIVGFDVMFQDYACGQWPISLEWDIWLGFIGVAKSVESEPLILAIAEWLSQKLAVLPDSSS